MTNVVSNPDGSFTICNVISGNRDQVLNIEESNVEVTLTTFPNTNTNTNTTQINDTNNRIIEIELVINFKTNFLFFIDKLWNLIYIILFEYQNFWNILFLVIYMVMSSYFFVHKTQSYIENISIAFAIELYLFVLMIVDLMFVIYSIYNEVFVNRLNQNDKMVYLFIYVIFRSKKAHINYKNLYCLPFRPWNADHLLF